MKYKWSRINNSFFLFPSTEKVSAAYIAFTFPVYVQVLSTIHSTVMKETDKSYELDRERQNLFNWYYNGAG